MTSCKRGRRADRAVTRSGGGLYLPDTSEKIHSLYVIMGFALSWSFTKTILGAEVHGTVLLFSSR